MRGSEQDVSKKHSTVSPDQRSKLDLELFVLSLIQRGINTPYRLQATAGLSPGATVPVLNRLKETGFLKCGKPGVRRRTEYEVTARGTRHLESQWKPLLSAPVPIDVEAILRVAVLALLSGGSRQMAISYLRRAAAAKAADSKRRKQDSEATQSSILSAGLPGLYPWMQAMRTVARLTAEGRLLRELANSVARLT